MRPSLTVSGRTPPTRAHVLLLVTFVALVGLLLGSLDEDRLAHFVGRYLVSTVAPATALLLLPAALLLHRAVIALGIFVLVAVPLVAPHRDAPEFDLRHDGGVVATAAATDVALALDNPYTHDFTGDLRPDHHTLAELDAPQLVNPLVSHYPYLPAAFLVQAPLRAAGSVVDHDVDPRILYSLVVVAGVAVLLWAAPDLTRRSAGVLALTASLAVPWYVSWGANDAPAATLVVIAAIVAARRPALAGVLIAVAISLKALLVVAVLPLAVLVASIAGRRAVERAAVAATVVLVFTVLPYLIADPGAFIEDTVAFNLGLTELEYPASGLGLAARHPEPFGGGVSVALSVVGAAAAAVAVAALVQRSRTPAAATAGCALLLLAVLFPARTFQVSYLVLFVVLLSPIWAAPRSHPPVSTSP